MELRNINIGLLIFRLNIGVLMLFHGVQKLIHGIDGIRGMLADLGLPTFLAYGVHVGETIAPILLIIGFRTRFAALAFAFVMVVAFGAHPEYIFSLGKSGGWAAELAALYLFGGLGLYFTGGGKYSLSTTSKWD